MKSVGITRINEKDEEITEILETLGVSRMSARSLAGIRRLGTAKVGALERAAGLRQPEVSIGVRDLIDRGWVTETNEKQSRGKGRPSKLYYLKVGFPEIIADLERAKREEAKVTAMMFNTLRALSKKN